MMVEPWVVLQLEEGLFIVHCGGDVADPGVVPVLDCLMVQFFTVAEPRHVVVVAAGLFEELFDKINGCHVLAELGAVV